MGLVGFRHIEWRQLRLRLRARCVAADLAKGENDRSTLADIAGKVGFRRERSETVW
jgi:hypothetical protein